MDDLVEFGMSTLADRFEELSRNLPRGWQADLARACKVKPPSVAGWLSGKAKSMSDENLLCAAAFFKVNPTWLATGLGPKVSEPMSPVTKEIMRIYDSLDDKMKKVLLEQARILKKLND